MKKWSVLVAGLLLAMLVAMALAAPAEEASTTTPKPNKRCKYFDFIKACKISCKVLGHTTGVCDRYDVCHCSEDEYNFFTDVVDWFDSLDVMEMIQRMMTKFQTKIKEFGISEELKDLIPSKCKVGSEFCSKACHSIGRVSGKCNKDFTDCDCSDEHVTPTQYALCAMDTICRLDCQRKGLATGHCKGAEEWDCVCVSDKNQEVTNEDADKAPKVDIRGGEVDESDLDNKTKIVFNAR